LFFGGKKQKEGDAADPINRPPLRGFLLPAGSGGAKQNAKGMIVFPGELPMYHLTWRQTLRKMNRPGRNKPSTDETKS